MQIDVDGHWSTLSSDPDYAAGFRRGLETVARQARMVLLKQDTTLPLLPEHRSLLTTLNYYLKILASDRSALLDLLQRWQMLGHAAHRKGRDMRLSAQERHSAQGFEEAAERACGLVHQLLG
jgi:beta-lactamase class A